MMACRTPLLALAVAFGIGACQLASAQSFACPARFPAKSLQFGPADGGWMAAAGDLGAPLESIGLFSGPPQRGAMLQPTSADGLHVSWRLEGPYPEGVWVQCAYGRDSLTLSKPLPTMPKTCVAIYGKEHAFQPREIQFSCR